ncbi:MAG: hypothetical protein IIB94_09475 [Candidatus Marinimicrobia bacterium]|nr:hypothetical protein [Candidatus Neomarinimicrobiota bacterium]
MNTILARTLLIITIIIFTIACGGPQGEPGVAGTDGIDGVDGNITCLACHNTETKTINEMAYSRSKHAEATTLDYAGGRSSCARCHSGTGFVEFQTTGEVIANLSNPEAISCKHCHGLHTTFEEGDIALRMQDTLVLLIDDLSEISLGSSNLCATCHQPRRNYSYYDDGTGDSVYVSSTHAGPHHGPQSTVLLGMGGDERIGSIDITALGAATHGINVKCTGCHMHKGTDETVGGHTWWPNVEKCQECHSDAADFDVNGYITATDVKIETLFNKLLAIGIVDSSGNPVKDTFTRTEFSAFWNYMTVVEDRSHGVHNPAYVKALLDNALEVLP